jgi:hypothetical protein
MPTVTIPKKEYEALIAVRQRYEYLCKVVREDIPLQPYEQDDVLTSRQRKIIDQRLAEAEEDVKAGRVSGPFNTIKELTAHLNSKQ